MISIISALVVLGILIFVHELGHFIVAKLSGVGVHKFSLGFGPKLFGKKVGETEYLVSALPLGGYVKMFEETGEEEELTEEQKGRTFGSRPPILRIAIVAAGPFSNLLFAWLIFILLFMVGVPAQTTRVGDVLKDKPAAQAGIRSGDLVESVNGVKTTHWEDLSHMIVESDGKPLHMRLKRGSGSLDVTVTPEQHKAKNLFGETVSNPAIGIISSAETVTERFNPADALIRGSEQTWTVIKLTGLTLVKLAQRVVPLDTIGGPIMIAKMAGQQASQGGMSFLAFMALLSINLGVLNLLPIPVLDGGVLMFNIVELIFRRPVSMRVRETAQQIGLVLLIGLMVLAFYNDIARYLLGQG